MSVLLSIMFAIVSTPWRAFVIFKVWFWFLVPVWPMLAAPKWNVYGVALIAGYMTTNYRREDRKQGKHDWIFSAVLCIFMPGIFLLTAWVIKAMCL